MLKKWEVSQRHFYWDCFFTFSFHPLAFSISWIFDAFY